MLNESLFIHNYIDQTTIHPLGLIILLILGALVVVLNRRSAITPLLIMACFVAPAQRVVVLGLDFNLIRILVLLGWVRVFLKGENKEFNLKPIDIAILAWTLSGFFSYVMLWGTINSFVYKLGNALDTAGMYFLFRFLVRDLDDIKHNVIALLYLSLPVAVFLLFERHTGRNLFSVFGGVPEFTMIREGKLRAQGAFAHAILAGCFWVTQLPLFLALWLQGSRKLLISSSVLATLIIIYACSSSTPVAALGAVFLGYFFWLSRARMKVVRWCVVVIVVILHLLMKAPVWHLISRIDIVGGSTGWHRFNLIDQAINRFNEWWLFGTKSTAHWGWFLFDTANMYVNEAVRGGFLSLVLFLIVIALAFQGIGRIILSLNAERINQIFVWSLGVSLFTHCMVFVAVSYFGQIIVVWYLLLASIGSLTPTKKNLKNSETFQFFKSDIAGYKYL